MSREIEYRTKNDVKIYAYKNTAQHGFYLSLYVKAGSMYESEDECGITHFFEHVAVRNVNAVRRGKLYAQLDRYGIDFNASTYSEMVQFYVSGASENFSVGASVITDLLSPLVLSVQEVDAERGRIRAEIRESDDKSSLVSFSSGIVFEETTLARQITGTAKSISRISRKKLEEYRKRILTRENIFFYVTGNFTDADIRGLSEMIERFKITSGEARSNIAPVPKGFFDRPGTPHVKNADFTMARFTFDLDMSKITMPESDLLYDILLSGYNSDFFIELSERRGLFYDLTGATERYKNIGTLAFSFEVKSGKLYEATEVIVEILNSYKRRPLPENKCMKSSYVDNAYMLFDDFRELNFTFSYDNHIMELGYQSIEERKRAYESVTPERLLEVAAEVFKVKNLTLTVKGNKKTIDTERLAKIILGLR